MVLILDCHSETGVHVQNNLSYLICLRYLIRSRAATNQVFFLKRPIFLHKCTTCYELPASINTMQKTKKICISPLGPRGTHFNPDDIRLKKIYMEI